MIFVNVLMEYLRLRYFFPCMVCKDIAFITNIVNGATILGAKPIIEKSIKNIAKVFTKRNLQILLQNMIMLKLHKC